MPMYKKDILRFKPHERLHHSDMVTPSTPPSTWIAYMVPFISLFAGSYGISRLLTQLSGSLFLMHINTIYGWICTSMPVHTCLYRQIYSCHSLMHAGIKICIHYLKQNNQTATKSRTWSPGRFSLHCSVALFSPGPPITSHAVSLEHITYWNVFLYYS